jgi:GalNAc-alpha-(1->4)-GalNAc-alpha-(1->3)-diNAcBac-PP-undecaprenol alpha-1,4-N-acetyl-D-galactosaminyltransferase
MRITFTLPSLYAGGAERTVSNMANYWASRGEHVTILTLSHDSRPPAFELYPSITHLDIGYHKTSRQALPCPEMEDSLREIAKASPEAERAVVEAERGKLQSLRGALIGARPDAVISFESATNVRVLLATRDLQMPVIVSERSDPLRLMFKIDGWAALRQRLYHHAAWLVTLTEEARRYFADEFGDKCRVIPNFVLRPKTSDNSGDAFKPAACGDSKIVMGMGRLAPVKGFDLLLRAFAEIAARHPQWSLEIWGEGALLPDLERIAQELRISERVSFGGFTYHTYNTLRRAQLFVLSSHYEGFPNALCEAMACGLPAISFDCPSGPRNIIRHEVDGILVEAGSVPALSASMDRMMADEMERDRLARRAPDVVERFSPETIMKMWDELILGNARAHAASAGGIKRERSQEETCESY